MRRVRFPYEALLLDSSGDMGCRVMATREPPKLREKVRFLRALPDEAHETNIEMGPLRGGILHLQCGYRGATPLGSTDALARERLHAEIAQQLERRPHQVGDPWCNSWSPLYGPGLEVRICSRTANDGVRLPAVSTNALDLLVPRARRRLHSRETDGAIVQQENRAIATRRSGCDSPSLHHLQILGGIDASRGGGLQEGP